MSNEFELQTEKTIKKTIIERGKFSSLTLINWNGFFARTFDLDNLVTTLSGGNGAGKSTTMAGFVTALIPDLTLLNFRNTTEAGATGGRDRGLYGKLKSGVCYALLESVNSRGERIISGVRLNQVAGRDRKVDLRSFSVENLDETIKPIELVTERLEDNKARVLSLDELKEKGASGHFELKIYHAISEYHSFLFDNGLLPKRLRTPSDRSKFYKLIEASLYGGISGAITKSLREYLLPENTGVKQAFSDMQLALNENKMTLMAIELTQRDRNTFKQLIDESTNYVGADYMRVSNERSSNIEQLLALRKNWYQLKNESELNAHKLIEFSKELQDLEEKALPLEEQFEKARTHLHFVENAFKHQEKIERYKEELFDLSEKIEMQQESLEEIIEQLEEAKFNSAESEDLVDDLRAQLADVQKALDSQQKMALLYEQAIGSLENAKNLTAFDNLTLENASDYLDSLSQDHKDLTDEILELSHSLNLSRATKDQFDKTFNLLLQIEQVEKKEAFHKARSLVEGYQTQKQNAHKAKVLKVTVDDLYRKVKHQEQLLALQHQLHNDCELDEISYEQQLEIIDDKTLELEEIRDKRVSLNEQAVSINQENVNLSQKAPAYFVAQNALHRLNEQMKTEFTSSKMVMNELSASIELERKNSLERDKLQVKSDNLTRQIQMLNEPFGANDPRLSVIAEKLDGVLLSELYEDVSLEDAPFFSALYSQMKDAIVVKDLSQIEDKIAQIEDCPDNIYFIKGDSDSFDDSVFESNELCGGVLVRLSDRSVRFSKLPEVSIFGKDAREKQLEILKEKQKEIDEQYAICSFEAQKASRFVSLLTDFTSTHLTLAFSENPEEQIALNKAKVAKVEQEITALKQQEMAISSDLNVLRADVKILEKLLSQKDLVEDETLIERYEELQSELDDLKEDEIFVQQYGNILEMLSSNYHLLKISPDEFEQAQQDYEQKVSQQKRLNAQIFALKDLLSRRVHFSYKEQFENKEESSTDTLRAQLENAVKERDSFKAQVQNLQMKHTEYHNTLQSLQSAYNAKNDLINELSLEAVHLDTETAFIDAQEQFDSLQEQLNHSRTRRHFLDKELAVIQSQMDTLNKSERKAQRDYHTFREMVVANKLSWVKVLRLLNEKTIKNRLESGEMRYQTSETLRSISDKALGSLKALLRDNEYLKDSLRASEQSNKPELKVKFFIDVYHHLKERIRQDILKTDDPILAIEEMEVELTRLTAELNQREKKLAISSASVANILQKTILREQNRILQLNQGLQNIVFGQVKGVRLVVNIRHSHQMLLDALAKGKDEHRDLFESEELNFSQALATLYKRVNQGVDFGTRTAQSIGEELLDYRNYLELDVETLRGSDGWATAQSSSLSTGEAIGTGMSILLMVVQSWEDEARRIRAKDLLPARLLFLDEAARLDGKSINTLFELCERLDMQLLIAAPENISPERGTTYKLIRKILGKQEIVQVVGLKGFA